MTEALFDVEDVGGVAHAGQWRLAQVQLANWGTFDGAIYRIPVARRGHLLTGPSGSGKSSLLDAIAAVLTPDKWLRFNQAAQSAGARSDQRSIVSYVRGAWSRTADEVEDRVVSAYLRPRATWSGILLRYENGRDKPVTLARLFFARGTGTSSADVADLCLIERSDLDLRDLEPFARAGIETRRLQAERPDALITTNGAHSRFYARLRTLFAIGQDTALQLLHKTQSAKTLDSLDALFREYMLERPGTFDLADTAVAQFTELRDAHDHVVQLRLQRDHLRRLEEAATRYDEHDRAAALARELVAAVGPHRRLETLRLARGELVEATGQRIRLEADLETARAVLAAAEETAASAERTLHERGGAEVEHLRAQLRTVTATTEATRSRRETLQRRLGEVGIDNLPTTATEYAELMASVTRLRTASAATRGPDEQQQRRYFEARGAVRRLDEELQALRRSGTTVPAALLAVRADLAEATGLPVQALPFGAELITVRPEHAAWTGAIERVLRPLALTLLVRTEHLSQVRDWVEHRRIVTRLVFEEVRGDAPSARPATSDDSLLHRITVADGPFAPWLAGQLSDRFDYACVASPAELGRHQRAVTLNGQLKTSRTRYEKDDRIAIDDRSRWVLGDRESKLDALLDARRLAQQELDAAQAEVEAAERRQKEELNRAAVLGAVQGTPWSDIDVVTLETQASELESRLAELTRHDADLASATRAVETARAQKDQASAAAQEAHTALHAARVTETELDGVVTEIDGEIAAGLLTPPPDPVAAELTRRFRQVQRRLRRTTLPDVAEQVRDRLDREERLAAAGAQTAANDVTSIATQFSERWPTAAADLSPTLADRAGYLELLAGIVAHGLPEHEAAFLRLLRERSRDLIGELVSDIHGAPREIEERVRPVNSSLRRSPFDDDRFLHLRVKVRRSETVNQFIADLRSISEGSWGSDDLDDAERRFATLEEIMRRLGSSDHVDRVWRSAVLDTRTHVTFLAEEVDGDGRTHAAYDSGAAMSGGQQQKLVVFCLAAALRYQLSDAEDEVPRYGTVILDEAFDKADTRFTRMALDVFVEFGFHLVLATPQKLLQTIEPYVGGATAIENPDRRRSVVANVPWEPAERRVDTAASARSEASGAPR